MGTFIPLNLIDISPKQIFCSIDVAPYRRLHLLPTYGPKTDYLMYESVSDNHSFQSERNNPYLSYEYLPYLVPHCAECANEGSLRNTVWTDRCRSLN